MDADDVISERETIMLKAMRIVLGLVAVISLATQTARGAATDQAQGGEIVYNAVFNSMVVVKTSNSQGSGVVIGENHVVTNCHVVSDDGEITVTQYAEVEGEVRKFEMLAETAEIDSDHDLCVLQVLDLSVPPAMKPADLGSSSEIAIGENIYVVGSPYGYTHTVTEGLISQLRRCEDLELFNCEDHSAPVIQTDAAISPGSSGGGLFNNQGELIGVPTIKLAALSVEGISFAVPVEWIKSLKIYPKLARKNAMSEARNGNFAGAVEIAEGIRDRARQASVFARIASRIERDGDTSGARAVIARAVRAAEITEPAYTGRERTRRNAAWKRIARVQASFGEYTEAKFSASMITSKTGRASTLRAIAEEQIKDGMTTAAKATLSMEVLGIVRQIPRETYRARNYASTAVLLARVGEMEDAEEALADARAIVEELRSPDKIRRLTKFINKRSAKVKNYYGKAH